MRTKQQTKGFTLIEISLVIVAMALIIAGVLVGQTLIKSAGIRALVKQPSEMEAAINVFQEKYNCLPGDCKEAEEFGLVNVDFNGSGAHDPNSGGGGNGDGKIASHSFGSQSSYESMNAAYQLGKAGLIKVGR